MDCEINYLFELLKNPILREKILKYLKFDEIFRLRRLSRSMKIMVDEMYLPELKQLRRSDCIYGTPSSEAFKILSKHTCSLRDLDVSYIKINDHFIRIIQSNPNLIELSVRNCSTTSWYPIKSTFSLKNLTILHLNIVYMNPRDDESDWTFDSMKRSLAASPIQELCLENCNWVTDYVLEALSHCKVLRILSLQYCREITDTGLGYLGNGCPSLKTLYVKSNYRITNCGINLKILNDKGVTTWIDYGVDDDTIDQIYRKLLFS